jgi:hypothetical protein
MTNTPIAREIDVSDKAHEVVAATKDEANQAVHAAAELKDQTVAAAHTAQENVKDAAHDVKGSLLSAVRISSLIRTVRHLVDKAAKAEHAADKKATELKHDAVAAAHGAGEKVTEMAHQAQGTASSIASMPPLTSMFSRESCRTYA